MNMSSIQKRLGFTLIELLVVISIIGVLALVVIPNLVGARERARDARAKNDMRQLKTALRLYYNDYQQYPAAKTDIGTDGGTFTVSSTVYMQQLPATFFYSQTDSGQGFTAYTVLENSSDADIAASAIKCRVGAGAVTDAYYVCSD